MVAILHRTSQSRNLTAAQVDANFDLVSQPAGVVVARCAANGVTDDTAVIAAAIAALPATGGTVLLPTGRIICNNLAITGQGIKLKGVARGGIDWIGTRLEASGTNQILSHIGTSESNRLRYLILEDIIVWGTGAIATLVNLKYISYFRAYGCSFNNTQASWLKLWDVYDSSFHECEFSYGGSSDGTTYPGIELYSEGGSSATNEIYFERCRWESFAGSAIGMTGSNCYGIKGSHCKMESHISLHPFIRGNICGDIQFTDSVLTNITAGGLVESFIDIANAQGAVKFDVSLQILSGMTVTQYVKIASSPCVDLKLRLMNNCVAPAGGYIVNWDATSPRSFACVVNSELATPWYNYNNGSQLSPIDSSGTGTAIANGGTYAVPGRISAVWLDNIATVAAFTITLPSGGALESGQEISFFTTSAITTLTIGGGTVLGGPSTLAAGGFFTLRYVGLVSKWIRFA